MRAVVIDAFGDPDSVLQVQELPTPEPGPGEVRVRMIARPINPSDIFTITGQYGQLPELPATPGLEGVGVVDAVGAGVTGVEVGQRVVPGTRGTWREFVITTPDAILPVPEGLTDIQASMLLVNPTSAWLMLEDELRVKPGEWIVQNAGNSIVARFIAQIAKLRGYRVISVVRRSDLADELIEAGAEHVVSEVDEDVEARVREISGGKGAAYAIDSVAGESGSRLVRSLGAGGTMLVFGALSRQPLTIDPGTMLFRGTTIRGWWLTRWMRNATPAQRDDLFRGLVDLIRAGVLNAPIAAEFDLGDVVEAVRMARGSERNGKVILVG